MAIDAGIIASLKGEALFAAAASASAPAWGELAVSTEAIAPLANRADAQAEATRQAGVMATPVARDRIVVAGYPHQMALRLVTITANRLGYEAGAIVFVLSAIENDGQGTTTLTVLKRL